MEYNKDSVVIIDEAYVDFGGYSSVELTEKYENLLVTQTFSKSRSLAGMRIGFAIGSEKLISVLEAVKNSYNSYTVNSIAMAAGTAAMNDTAYFNETVSKVINTREKVKTGLRALGFEVLDSKTNFLMATHPKKDMKTKGVYKIFQQTQNKQVCAHNDRHGCGNGYLPEKNKRIPETEINNKKQPRITDSRLFFF